ncbi:MAG: D-alanyl-D-alanine carboxypeptidase [Clostridia bacterium]|nr:D-alanyl-D-alanine carboxypeptidase [Clostridia bacterium]
MMKKRIISLLLALACIFSTGLTVTAQDTTAPDTTTDSETTVPEETTAPETERLPTIAEGEEIILEMPTLVNVDAAVVYNIENDRYIYDLNADKVIYPASTVKLMTAIVAIELLDGDLDREITVPGDALKRVSGNNIALKQDEIMSARELLYALLCGNANDAANVLAYTLAGGIEEFVALMNEKAQELGAVNTHYTNPTGLHDDEMVTTARDTALIAAHAYKTSPITDMSTATVHRFAETNKAGERTLHNKNHFFSTVTEYIYKWDIPRGLNAGYTNEGGYCLATTVARDGLTYVVVTMGAKRDDKYIYSYTEAAKLIKWALYAYEYKTVLSTSDMICEIPVKLSGKTDYVTLFPSHNVELYLPTGTDVDSEIGLEWTLTKDYFTAPVSEGEVGGRVTISYNGMSVGTYDLVTRNSVNRDNILYVLDLIKGVTGTRAFKVIATIAGIGFVGYIAVLAYVTFNRGKRKK